MKLSLTSWSFPYCTLKESALISKALDINALDFSYFYKSGIDKKRLLKEPKEYAEYLKKELDIFVPCFYHLFGETLSERNLASDEFMSENTKDFKQLLIFCKTYGIPTIFVLPGVINAKQTREDALEVSAKNLNILVELAQKEGITLTIEAHIQSYLESPKLALKLLEKVNNLKLTLDYTHFVCLGFTQDEIDCLAPYAGHIHLRQAKMGFLQTKLEQGTINIQAMLSRLEEVGFNAYASLENVHQDYMDTLYDDVLSETIKMRDLFNEWNR